MKKFISLLITAAMTASLAAPFTVASANDSVRLTYSDGQLSVHTNTPVKGSIVHTSYDYDGRLGSIDSFFVTVNSDMTFVIPANEGDKFMFIDDFTHLQPVCDSIIVELTEPIDEPTDAPDVTDEPTDVPATDAPTDEPVITEVPTEEPTATPTATPTVEPTTTPTATPTATPTVEPTATPTVLPTATPTATPTVEPTTEPTTEPTDKPAVTVPAPNVDTPSGTVAFGTIITISNNFEPFMYSVNRGANEVSYDDVQLEIKDDTSLWVSGYVESFEPNTDYSIGTKSYEYIVDPETVPTAEPTKEPGETVEMSLLLYDYDLNELILDKGIQAFDIVDGNIIITEDKFNSLDGYNLDGYEFKAVFYKGEQYNEFPCVMPYFSFDNEIFFAYAKKPERTEAPTTEPTEEPTATPEPTAEPKVIGLSIEHEPTKKVYSIGEDLDLSGMVLTAIFDNGDTYTIDNITWGGKSRYGTYLCWKRILSTEELKLYQEKVKGSWYGNDFDYDIYQGYEYIEGKIFDYDSLTSGEKTITIGYSPYGKDMYNTSTFKIEYLEPEVSFDSYSIDVEENETVVINYEYHNAYYVEIVSVDYDESLYDEPPIDIEIENEDYEYDYYHPGYLMFNEKRSGKIKITGKTPIENTVNCYIDIRFLKQTTLYHDEPVTEKYANIEIKTHVAGEN